MNRSIVKFVGIVALISMIMINVKAYSLVCEGNNDYSKTEEHYYRAAASTMNEELENMIISEKDYLRTYELPELQFKHSIELLRQKYPQGKYWNGNNVDTYTSTPCNHNLGLGNCNCFQGHMYQCIGFAMHLSYLYTGHDPVYYKCYSGGNAVNNIEVGSVVRYRVNDYTDHAIFITAISGDRYYFADCNWGGTCNIRWNGSYSRGDLQWLLNQPLNQKWREGEQVSDIGFVLTINHNAKKISDCDVSVVGPDILKGESRPTVQVKYKGQILGQEDYTWYCSYSDAGQDEVTIVGRGDFSGSNTRVSYDYIYGQISECTVEYSKINDYASRVEPKVVLKNKYNQIVPNYEYSVEYEDSDMPGERTMTITARSTSNKYKGSIKLKYIVNKCDISNEKQISVYVAPSAVLEDGGAIPKIIVRNRMSSEELEVNVDYKVNCSNNTSKFSEGIVEITGIGNKYTGTVKETFKVTVDNDLKIH